MLFKGESRKEKLEYFWTYYRTLFLSIAATIIVITYFVHAVMTQKNIGFSAILFDCHSSLNEKVMEEEFTEYAEIDNSQYEISVNTTLLLSDSDSGLYTMTSLSKFYTDIGTKDLDVCVMLEHNFKTYAAADCFIDLRTCMSEEQLARYEGQIYERAGVPVGIYVDNLENTKRLKCYTSEDSTGIFGITYHSQHVEEAVKFIEFLSENL